MKKILCCLLLMTSLFSTTTIYANCNTSPNCCDTLIVLLFSSIKNEVNNYYKDYLTQLPTVAPYMMKLINLKSIPNETNAYDYTITLEVYPYLGAHNTIGTDHITFEIDLDGIQSTDFNHIKSEQLLDKYEKYVIKPLP